MFTHRKLDRPDDLHCRQGSERFSQNCPTQAKGKIESGALYRLEIGVRRWIANDPQHRDNLALVVKSVGYDV